MYTILANFTAYIPFLKTKKKPSLIIVKPPAFKKL